MLVHTNSLKPVRIFTRINYMYSSLKGHKKVCLRHPDALLCELHLALRATRWPYKNFFSLSPSKRFIQVGFFKFKLYDRGCNRFKLNFTQRFSLWFTLPWFTSSHNTKVFYTMHTTIHHVPYTMCLDPH